MTAKPQDKRKSAAGLTLDEDADETCLGKGADRAGSAWIRRCRQGGGIVRPPGRIPSIWLRTVETAAKLHDIGKADARFQRWLDPSGRAVRPLAEDHDRPIAHWRTDSSGERAGPISRTPRRTFRKTDRYACCASGKCPMPTCFCTWRSATTDLGGR